MKFTFLVMSLLLETSLILILPACKKSNDTPVCDIKGFYVGTSSQTSTGNTSPAIYRLQDNNFVTGSAVLGGPTTTYGGYSNTCDSVYLSVWYNYNNSYYLLKGKLLNNRTKISGSYQNLNTPTDYGTFTVDKQ